MRGQSRRSGGGGTIRDKLLNRSQRGRQMSASYSRSPNHKLTTSSVKSERTMVGNEASPGLETIKFFQTEIPGGEENENKIHTVSDHHHDHCSSNGMPNNHSTLTTSAAGLLAVAPTTFHHKNRHNNNSSSVHELRVTRSLQAAASRSFSTETEIY